MRNYVPFASIQGDADRDSSLDGALDRMEGMAPSGPIQNPRWEVIDNVGRVPFNIADETNISITPKFLSAYYQERSVKGKNNSSTDFDRWLVWYKVDETSSSDRKLVSTSLNSGKIEEDQVLLTISDADWNDDWRIRWQRINEQDVAFVLTDGENDSEMYFIYDDAVFPATIFPQLPSVILTTGASSNAISSFNDDYYGGNYPGILTQSESKYVGVIYAWRLPNGRYVKHSQPKIQRLAANGSPTTNVTLYTLTFTKYTGINYASETADYDTYLARDTGNKFGVDEAIEGPYIFITTPNTVRKNVMEDSVYFLIGEMNEITSFIWNENEERIPSGEVLNIDPFSHHVISGNVLGRFSENLCLGQIVTNLALPGLDWSLEYIGRAGLTPTTVYGPGTAYIDGILEATIEINGVVIQRRNNVTLINDTVNGVYINPVFSYPDRRAKSMVLYVNNSGTWEIISQVNLTPHNGLNIAYNLNSNISLQLYTLGSGSTVAEPSLSVNEIRIVEKNKARIADLDEYYLPLERTYEFKSEIFGFEDNTQEVGEGQFGSYPFYFLCKDQIYGGASSDSVFIVKIDVIDNDVGVVSPKAHRVYKNALYFASKFGFQRLIGNRVERIDYPLENYFGIGTTSFDAWLNERTDNAVSIAANHRTDEVLFASLFSSTIFVYNFKYEKWYTYQANFYGFANEKVSVFNVNEDAYLFDEGGGFNINNIVYGSENSFVDQWRYGTPEEYYFTGDTYEERTGFFISVTTKEIVLTSYSEFKKLYNCVVDCLIKCHDDSDDAYSSNEVVITLQGKRSTNNDWITLWQWQDNLSGNELRNLPMRNNKGSMQAFRITITGHVKSGSWIKGAVIEFNVRSRQAKA